MTVTWTKRDQNAQLIEMKNEMKPSDICLFLKVQKPKRSLGIHTLRPSVHLQASFSHLSILQKVHRHPHQMTLHLVQLLSRILGRHKLVKNVSSLYTSRWEITVIVVERFDCCGMLLRDALHMLARSL